MWAAYIKKQFPKKSLGKRGELRMLHGRDMVKISGMPSHRINEFFIIDDIENFIRPFKYPNRETYDKIFFSRGGAIGDLVSLSSPIVKLIETGFPVTLITDMDSFCVIDWFEKKPKKKNYNQAFIDNYKPKSEEAARLGHVDYLGTVELGARMNWFELYFKVMEAPFSPAWGRPRLTTERLPGEQQLYESDLLLNIKATDSRRNLPIWEVYSAVVKAGLLEKYNIVMHQLALNETELKWITENKPKIEILGKTSKPQALLNFYDAGMVISTDTGALHFREGVQRPAIGLYTAFSTESRTKYYLYTRNYELKSGCKKQPCFEHGSVNGNHCSMNPEKLFYSPCATNVEDQLTKIFKTL